MVMVAMTSSAVKSLLFFTPERPSRRALRECCHGGNIKELVVLFPSETSHNQYVCYATRHCGFFVNYDAAKIARKFKFRNASLISTSSEGRYTINRLLFFCFMDMSTNLTGRLYYTHGIYPKAVMTQALRSQIIISESHPKILYLMRSALRGPMVDDAIVTVIKQGQIPDLSQLTLD